MTRTTRKTIGQGFTTVCLLALGGCAWLHPFDVNNSWPEHVDETYRAVVKTTPLMGETPDPAKNVERLKAYHEALQAVVGTSNLEEQYIGCNECGDLNGSPQPSALTYIFFREHRADTGAFLSALAKVQAGPLKHPGLTVSFDTMPPPDKVCPQRFRTMCMAR